MLDPVFVPLEDHVRHALAPDEPRVLYEYLRVCDEVAWETRLRPRRMLYRRVFTVLMGAISDTANPTHWRWLCLDNIYRPIQELHRCARTKSDLREVRTCSYHVQQVSEALLQVRE
ncbi:MAG: hypothetical protein AAF513_04335 [Pseudomonadota bacterium]